MESLVVRLQILICCDLQLLLHCLGAWTLINFPSAAVAVKPIVLSRGHSLGKETRGQQRGHSSNRTNLLCGALVNHYEGENTKLLFFLFEKEREKLRQREAIRQREFSFHPCLTLPKTHSRLRWVQN